MLISDNCCWTGESSSRWKPSWLDLREENPLEPPGEIGDWMFSPLVGDGDLVSWEPRLTKEEKGAWVVFLK